MMETYKPYSNDLIKEFEADLCRPLTMEETDFLTWLEKEREKEKKSSPAH